MVTFLVTVDGRRIVALMLERLGGDWKGVERSAARPYRCGHCSREIAAHQRYQIVSGSTGEIRICPHCNRPTFFDPVFAPVPGSCFGESVDGVPEAVDNLYEEARNCTSLGAYTAAVLALRKLLMHIAVEKGADEGKSFAFYVDYLYKKNYVPPDGKAWVDRIRTKGNEANHEIVLMKRADAEQLITFAGTLLKIIYEFPGRLAKAEPEED